MKTQPAGAGNLLLLQTAAIFFFDNVAIMTAAAPICQALWWALPWSPSTAWSHGHFLSCFVDETLGDDLTPGFPSTEASARLQTPELQRPT